MTARSHDVPSARRLTTGGAWLLGVGLLLSATACSSLSESSLSRNGPARTPLAKLEKLLALDFSPAKVARRQRSFRRLLEVPDASAQRLERLQRTALRMPEKLEARIASLPTTLLRTARAEAQRSLTMLDPSPLVRAFRPDLDAVARTTARDLERLAFLLGLERRPMGEPDDRRHRTNPYDDRPEKSLWYRLVRRLFP